jgi:hypothetical protein
MRDIERIDRIINKLRNYWKIYPDLRFNQMIDSLICKTKIDAFYLEDDEFEQLINLQIVNLMKETCDKISKEKI